MHLKNTTYDDCVMFKQEHPDFTRTELKQHHRRYFDAMKRLGVLDELYPTPQQKRDAITIEECIVKAQEYTSIGKFRDHHKYMYRRIIEAGVQAEAFKNCNKHGMFERMIYVYEFSDNHAYVGLTHDYKERGEGHIRDTKSQVYKHIKKTGLQPIRKELTDYMPYDKAQVAEGEWVEKYKQGGWIMLNKAVTGGLGSSRINANHVKMIELSKQGLTVTEIAYELGCSTTTVRRLAKANPEFIVNNKKIVPVEQYTKEGVFVKRWKSVLAAAKELNINVGNIHEVCAGKYGRKTAGSYKWKFAK